MLSFIEKEAEKMILKAMGVMGELACPSKRC